MRTVALVVAVAVALSSTSAFADDAPKQRGFLSGLGVGLLVLGSAGLGLGGVGTVSVIDSNTVLTPLLTDSNGQPMDPAAEDAATVEILSARRDRGAVAMGVGLGVGVASIVTGIILLVLDAPPPVLVTFTPTPQGGAFSLSATF